MSKSKENPPKAVLKFKLDSYEAVIRNIMKMRLASINRQQENATKLFKVYYSPNNPFEDCENNLSNVQHLLF